MNEIKMQQTLFEDYRRAQILHTIRAGFPAHISLVKFKDNEHLIRLPFFDPTGDPIQVTITTQNQLVRIDDAGAVAGLLFSPGHHEEHTTAFKLVTDLARAHDLEIDFNEGTISISTTPEHITEALWILTTVIITVLSAVPHLRVPTENS